MCDLRNRVGFIAEVSLKRGFRVWIEFEMNFVDIGTP